MLSFSSLDMVSFHSLNIFKIDGLKSVSRTSNVWASSRTVPIGCLLFLCVIKIPLRICVCHTFLLLPSHDFFSCKLDILNYIVTYWVILWQLRKLDPLLSPGFIAVAAYCSCLWLFKNWLCKAYIFPLCVATEVSARFP